MKGRGIRVNTVSPGMVLTSAMQTYLENNEGGWRLDETDHSVREAGSSR